MNKLWTNPRDPSLRDYKHPHTDQVLTFHEVRRTGRKARPCTSCEKIISSGAQYVDCRHPKAPGEAFRFCLPCWNTAPRDQWLEQELSYQDCLDAAFPSHGQE